MEAIKGLVELNGKRTVETFRVEVWRGTTFYFCTRKYLVKYRTGKMTHKRSPSFYGRELPIFCQIDGIHKHTHFGNSNSREFVIGWEDEPR
jgi:hypothetical protein